ncbi:MAG TPA: hypothetical protein VK762_15425 [Polyangiaceae bacterium]|nr:hypothetical protein [Polyangiaceae bacterium]
MVDPRSPLSLLVEAEMKKPGVMRELRVMAKRIAMSHEEQDAKDLLAKSLVRVIDPDDDPWRPGAHSFLAHMHRSMRKVRYREQRALLAKKRPELVFDGGIAQEGLASEGPRADDELEDARAMAVWRKLGAILLARLVDDPLATQLYETARKEDLEPSEEAARFNVTVADIKAARARLRYHGQIVLDEWNAQEDLRMKAVRQQASTQSEEGTP